FRFALFDVGGHGRTTVPRLSPWATGWKLQSSPYQQALLLRDVHYSLPKERTMKRLLFSCRTAGLQDCRSVFGAIVCAAALVTGSERTAFAQSVISASGPDADSIQPAVDLFRDRLGELRPNEPVSFPDGRREINWDGVPAALSSPNPFPGDFFNFNAAPRARG